MGCRRMGWASSNKENRLSGGAAQGEGCGHWELLLSYCTRNYVHLKKRNMICLRTNWCFLMLMLCTHLKCFSSVWLYLDIFPDTVCVLHPPWEEPIVLDLAGKSFSLCVCATSAFFGCSRKEPGSINLLRDKPPLKLLGVSRSTK